MYSRTLCILSSMGLSAGMVPIAMLGGFGKSSSLSVVVLVRVLSL